MRDVRSILFVCTANICRSPTAEAVLNALLQRNGFPPGRVLVDSAGTHDYRAGSPALDLAVSAARRRGYEVAPRAARRVTPGDFDRFDHILAMDFHNMAHLQTVCPTRCKGKVEMLLEYGDRFHGLEVHDPYGGPEEDFERALDMIEDGCTGFSTMLMRVERVGA